MKTKITVIPQFCIFFLTALALTIAGVATAQDSAASKSSSVSAGDKLFMRKAAKGGMMEVAMGKLASERGQNADVKKFGDRMVADHSKANEELGSIVEKKGVKLPSKKPSATWKSDKDYMNAMVKDHEKDLDEFQKEAREGNDPDIKGFAERTAKIVQEHLDLAKETQSKLQ